MLSLSLPVVLQNLDEVRIYDEEERFIMTAPMYRDIMLPYGCLLYTSHKEQIGNVGKQQLFPVDSVHLAIPLSLFFTLSRCALDVYKR